MNYKQQLYISIFSIILVTFLLFLFFISPSLRAIVSNSEELALRRQELASIEYLSQSFEGFEKNFQFYKEGLSQVDDLLQKESLIDPEIPVNFINFFKDEALNLDLVLKISPITFHESDNGQWGFMSFRVEGKGKFDDIMSFLEKMENSRWLIKETSFDISNIEDNTNQKKQSSGGDYVEINLLIEAYAQN